MEIWEEINNKQKELDMALKTYRENGMQLADAEKEYKIALREEILKLKDEGMAATLIQLVAYGIPKIARLRFERDCREAIYKANQEAINVKKLELKIIQDQFNKEYNNARND